MRQIVPVFLYPPAVAFSNYNVQMICGINGWAVKVTDLNFTQIGPAIRADYGDQTGQFAKLANLWSTYTVESVTAKFTPSQTSAGTVLSPILSIVDVVGGNNSADFATTLAVYNRSNTVQYSDPLKCMQRHLEFGPWLSQAVPNPYLLTILDNNREVYQMDAVSRVPDIQIAFQATPTWNPSGLQPILLGLFETNARLRFRGRRLDEQLLSFPVRKNALPSTQIGTQSKEANAQPQDPSAQGGLPKAEQVIRKPVMFDANGRAYGLLDDGPS